MVNQKSKGVIFITKFEKVISTDLKMIKKYTSWPRLFLLILLFLVNTVSKAQDGSHIRISLLTCTPGDELYSIFGHSALRIVDSSNYKGYANRDTTYSDIVYNYGTFNFDDPGFYLKFIRGKLLYSLSTDNFNDFIFEYQMTNRGITEQVLDLSDNEKKELYQALLENTKEENRYYKYDFFLDNCTTRLRDLIAKNKSPLPLLPAVMPTSFTFRNAIHQYLDAGKQYWSKLGIDILLGARTDGIMTSAQQEFLPDNLMKAFDSVKNVNLVQSSHQLFIIQKQDKNAGFTPLWAFSLLLIVYVLLSLPTSPFFKNTMVFLDVFLFFITGLLGIILIFMWFGTDHSMTKDNYNLLWALPTHLIMAFFIRSKKIFAKKYFIIVAIINILLLICWFFLPQQFNNALIPFIILLAYRCICISKRRV